MPCLQVLADREIELTALTRLRFGPDGSAVQFYDLLAMGKPDTRTLISCPGVQSLKNDKDPFEELRLDTDAVIPHHKPPMVGIFSRPDGDGRYPVGMSEFNGVDDEILQQQF